MRMPIERKEWLLSPALTFLLCKIAIPHLSALPTTPPTLFPNQSHRWSCCHSQSHQSLMASLIKMTTCITMESPDYDEKLAEAPSIIHYKCMWFKEANQNRA